MVARGRVITGAVLFVFVVVPRTAGAFELSGGVGVGGFLAGAVPRLAVSPNAALSWSMENGFLFAAHDAFNILPPINGTGIGVYNQTSISIGYASENANFSAGPSLSIFSMTACGATLCGRVTGFAPGGNALASLFFSGPLGLSVSVNVDWMGAGSRAFPGGIAAMVVAGPVFRWNSK